MITIKAHVEPDALLTLRDLEKEEPEQHLNTGNVYPVLPPSAATICLVSSDEYAPFASVVLQSMISNTTSEHQYDIVVLTNDMCLQNRKRLVSQASRQDNISIRIFDVSQLVETSSLYTWAHFSGQTYYRLLIPDIFVGYEKVIYLDSDVVVNRDIYELYVIDITEYLLAAAYDTHVVSYCTRTPALEQRQYNIDILGMTNPEEYFQIGVAIFNINKIREAFGSCYFFEQAQKSKLRWLDQDLINKLCHGQIKLLPNNWNVMVANLPDQLDECYLPSALREAYRVARNDPYIVHYIGRSIPCCAPSNPDLFEYFWRYARHTEFYERLLAIMMETTVSQHVVQSVPPHHSSHLKEWMRRIANTLLPKGTKRRIVVKNLISKLHGWH